MDFLNAGVPIGRWFGITVRLHFTFLIFAFWQAFRSDNVAFGIAWVGGLYFCILLHEFGHALAARWCDGEAEDILLWPLGGLAFVRPAWHPTAHLITTVAGPFVTLVLWLAFAWIASYFPDAIPQSDPLYWVAAFVFAMREVNFWLLLFNLIPCFPMDGGRILRDTIWHFMSAEKATAIACHLSRFIALATIAWVIIEWTGAPLPPLPISTGGTILLSLFIFWQTAQEPHIVALESRGTYQFSVLERLRRGRRQRTFRAAVVHRGKEDVVAGFHRCHVCGRTENDSHTLEFRVCSDCAGGEEYCQEHLHSHKHV